MSYFSVFQAAINTVFLGVVSYGVVVISGLLFTRRRKDLAEITYNPKIGKISLVTLAAVFGILALIPVIIAGLTTFELSSLLLVLGVYLFGAVIYLVMRRRTRYSKKYRRSREFEAIQYPPSFFQNTFLTFHLNLHSFITLPG